VIADTKNWAIGGVTIMAAALSFSTHHTAVQRPDTNPVTTLTYKRVAINGVGMVLKTIGQFLVVALPTLFTLLWTIDAALVPGADVFFIALLQLVFLVGYFAWDGYRS
jgi:hypothetical protein